MSSLITIRHGKTNYTEQGLDLTNIGIQETIAQADALESELSQYDEIIVLTSPQARAQGTAQVFLDRLSISASPRIMRTIRCIDIYDSDEFRKFEQENSTEIYGDMWLNHPDLEGENGFVEPRSNVRQRANIFLRNIVRYVSAKSQGENKNICVLAFSHFEILSYYIQQLYGDSKFPTLDKPGAQNSEPIIIRVNPEDSRQIVIEARGIQKTINI